MRFKTAIIFFLGSIFLSVVGVNYYAHIHDRAMLLKYVSDFADGTMIHLEDQITNDLENNKTPNIQKRLDKTHATHNFISAISFSRNGDKIDYSSDRTSRNKQVDSGYITSEPTIYNDLLNGSSNFKYKIKYFDQGVQAESYLYLDLDKKYLFEAINKQSIKSAEKIFLFQIALLTVMLIIIMRLFVKPLYQIIKTARDKDGSSEGFFIYDFSLLQSTLIHSFKELAGQKKELEASLKKTLYLDEILRTVADVNQLLISSENINDLLQKSCDRLAQFGHYKLAWVGFVDGENISIKYKSNDPTAYIESLHISMESDNPTSKGPSASCILQNKTVVADNIPNNPRFAPWKEAALKAGFHSSISLPLRKDIYTKAFGTLAVYTDNKNGFDPQEVAMLEELAGDIGFAINSFWQTEDFKTHLITDHLTGLPNRTVLFDELQKNQNPSVAIVNIDRFKDINEVYGFHVGDTVIKIYGEWLKSKVSKFDLAKLYKLSGGEYAILFSEDGDESSAEAFIATLIKDTEERVFDAIDIEIFVNITVGYAKSSAKTIEYAEIALKKAKENNWHFARFDHSLLRLEEQESNITWYKNIKNAIKEDKIIPYFQPIVNNKTGLIEKYEALIRLQMPDGKIASPFSFLEISKKIRLYPQLTKIMFTKTIEAFKGKNMPVSINLSFDDLVEKDMQDFLYETTLKHGIGNQIIFEILESEGIKSYEEVKAFIDRFRAIGCSFAIDDFGSGYSNFDHILKLNVDTLKIDGSLIKNLPSDKNAQIIVKNINNFAKEMDIKTVAEFVCNEAVFLHVKEIGIDLSQGYYFYEPKPHLQ